MAKKKVSTGIYTDTLSTGKNFYVRIKAHGMDKYVNVTKEYGASTLKEAKENRITLLANVQTADLPHVKGKKLVNTLIEEYIAQRPINPRYPSRSQQTIIYNLYKRNIEKQLKYVNVGQLHNKHLMKIKEDLDKRKIGQTTFDKIQRTIKGSTKDYIDNFTTIFRNFKALDKNTNKRQQKFNIDEYLSDNLEIHLKVLYNYFDEQYNNSKTQKDKDKFSFLLFLLLTARRTGEASLYQIKDIECLNEAQQIYIIKVRAETSKEKLKGIVLVPIIVLPYIKERLNNAKPNEYLFPTNISTIDYQATKALNKLPLKKYTGLGAHFFRSFILNILSDRGVSVRVLNYVMARRKTKNVDATHYEGDLTVEQRLKVFKALRLYERISNGTEPIMEHDFQNL